MVALTRGLLSPSGAGVRALRAARRDGLAGTARRAAGELRTRVMLREEHIWWELPLDSMAPPPDLPEGVDLVRAGEPELDLLRDLDGAIAGDAARQHVAEGWQPWVALRGATPVFACWILPGRAPTIASPTGWVQLPDGMVALEDSVTSPTERGQGLAPRALGRVAWEMRAAGHRSLLTKCALSNRPVQRVCAKLGFRPVARMRLTRTALTRLVRVEPAEGTGKLLAEQLDGATP